MDPQTVADFVKPAIGPFVGASFAFILARVHDARRQRRENIAAGNIALTTLNSMLNEHYLWRVGIYADLADPNRSPDSPVWLMMRPAAQYFGDHEIDLKSLAFLFEDPSAINALNAVKMAQIRFRDMVKMNNFRNDAAVAVLDIVSKDEFPIFEAKEKAVGPQRIATMVTAIQSVVKRARDEEPDYIEAHDKLRTALQRQLSVWWAGSPRLVNRSEVQGHFRKENLPALPAQVMTLMDEFDRRSAAARAVPVAVRGEHS